MGNLAGYQGAVAAHAMGFINDIDAWAIKPMNIYDVVPGGNGGPGGRRPISQ
jgi:hypothetical protein